MASAIKSHNGMMGSADKTTTSSPPGVANQIRWDRVVQAAAVVFEEKGYRAATLQDVALRLGMNKASLYYYIEAKEDLLFEILRRAHLQGIGFVEEDEDIAQAEPPIRLASLIHRWIEGVGSRQVSVHVAEYDFRHLTGPRRQEILDMRRRIADVVEDIIRTGVRDGSFDPSIDVQMAVTTLFRMLNTDLWYLPGSRHKPDDVADWITRLFVSGLSPR